MQYPDSPATFAQFREMFPDDDACIDWLAAWRWPGGFSCPACGCREATRLRTRPLWQCRTCREQTSVTAGTALHRTKLPLVSWVFALWLVSRRKNSVSALQLQRELGVAYRTAWLLLQKVRRTLAETGEYPLSEGVVEVDEAMVGGRSGRRGRRLGVGGAWIVVAVERLVRGKPGKKKYRASGSARATVVGDTSRRTLMEFVTSNIAKGATLASDAWTAYHSSSAEGYDHWPAVVDTPAMADVVLPKTHLLVSNFKAWLIGTFHGVTHRYLGRYLDEFIYRFNRRARGEDIMGFVARRLLHAQHAPLVEVRASC